MEPDGDGFVREQGGRVFGNDGIWVIDADGEVSGAIGSSLAIFAAGLADGELVSAEDMLGTEIAGADAVGTAEEARGFLGSHFRNFTMETESFVGFAESDADVARERVVAGETFIGAFQDDDTAFSAESVDDGGFREGADDVNVDGADFGVALFAEIIAGGIDVFGGATERDEDGIGILGFVFGDEAVIAASEAAEFVIGVLEELEDGLVEIVAASDDTVHM